MRSPGEVPTGQTVTDPLRWAWVAGGILVGSAAISLFVFLVDPAIEQPEVAGAVVVLSVLLVGILVGYRSPGETILEAGVAGLALLVLTAVFAAQVLGVELPWIVVLYGAFLVPLVSMMGGWTGEILQGTLEEAYVDRAVDWPWVFVSIVIGVTLSAYAVFLGRVLFGHGPLESLLIFAGSFLVTGWIVGHFSPGITMVEPAIAALLMIVVDGALVIMWFDDLDRIQMLLLGFGGGMVLALVGGWLGERTQRWAVSRGGEGRAANP